MNYKEFARVLESTCGKSNQEFTQILDYITSQLLSSPREFRRIVDGIDVDIRDAYPYLYVLYMSRYVAFDEFREDFSDNITIADRNGPVFIEPITRLPVRKILILNYGDEYDRFMGIEQLRKLRVFGMAIEIHPKHCLHFKAHEDGQTLQMEIAKNLGRIQFGITENVYVSLDFDVSIGMNSGVTFVSCPIGNRSCDHSRSFANANIVVFNPGNNSFSNNNPEWIKRQELPISLLSRPRWIIIRKNNFEEVVDFAVECGARFTLVSSRWTLNRLRLKRKKSTAKSGRRYAFGSIDHNDRIIIDPHVHRDA